MFARQKIDGIKNNAKNPLQCKQIGRSPTRHHPLPPFLSKSAGPGESCLKSTSKNCHSRSPCPESCLKSTSKNCHSRSPCPVGVAWGVAFVAMKGFHVLTKDLSSGGEGRCF